MWQPPQKIVAEPFYFSRTSFGQAATKKVKSSREEKALSKFHSKILVSRTIHLRSGKKFAKYSAAETSRLHCKMSQK
jgi:hypothetical protein